MNAISIIMFALPLTARFFQRSSFICHGSKRAALMASSAPPSDTACAGSAQPTNQVFSCTLQKTHATLQASKRRRKTLGSPEIPPQYSYST